MSSSDGASGDAEDVSSVDSSPSSAALEERVDSATVAPEQPEKTEEEHTRTPEQILGQQESHQETKLPSASTRLTANEGASSPSSPSERQRGASTTLPRRKRGRMSDEDKQRIEGNRLDALKKRAQKREMEDRERRKRLGASKLAEYGHQHGDSTAPRPSDEVDQKTEPASTLSAEQREILQLVEDGKNLCVLGSAGTGKSYLISEITKLLRYNNVLAKQLNLGEEPFSIAAPTGIAALNIDGVTLNRWAGIGLGDQSIMKHYTQILNNPIRLKSWKETQTLIIDEVSMVQPGHFLRLNVLGKLLRGDPRPFGGIQLIVVGDFFQLPPVDKKLSNLIETRCVKCGRNLLKAVEDATVTSRDHVKVRCSDRRDRDGEVTAPGCGWTHTFPTYVFETADWAECQFEIRELTTVHRQSDPRFIEALEKVRRGKADKATLDYFRTCGSSLENGDIKIRPTKLMPKRMAVDAENAGSFDKLPGEDYSFKSLDGAKKLYAESIKVQRLKESQAPKIFDAKIGTQVILVHNLAPEDGLVNGTRGVIVGFVRRPSETEVREAVRSKDTQNAKYARRREMIGTEEWKAEAQIEYYDLQRHDWLPEVYFGNRRRLNHNESEERTRVITPVSVVQNFGAELGLIVRTQIPLQHGWALTIHKSQGQSCDAVIVDCEHCFAPGQAYVALSRCRTPQGMKVLGLKLSSIKTSPVVKRFHEAIAAKTVYPTLSPPNYDPLSYLDPGVRSALNLEETFTRPSPTAHPTCASPLRNTTHASKIPRNPTHPSTSSKVPPPVMPVAYRHYSDQLFIAARSYISARANVGVSGGIVTVDDGGFIEAARQAFARAQQQVTAQEEATPAPVGGEKAMGREVSDGRKRTNDEPEASRTASVEGSPTKRVRATRLGVEVGAEVDKPREVVEEADEACRKDLERLEQMETCAMVVLEEDKKKIKKREKQKRYKMKLKARKKLAGSAH